MDVQSMVLHRMLLSASPLCSHLVLLPGMHAHLIGTMIHHFLCIRTVSVAGKYSALNSGGERRCQASGPWAASSQS